MRIDRLEIQNFKKFESLALDLHPQFTLLVGENGSGKTTILDALAVCLSIWLEKAPDTKLINSRRPILPNEIRAEPIKEGDRIQFQERFPVEVTATGQIGGSKSIEWTRRIKDAGSKTSNSEAKEALNLIHELYARADIGENRPLFPVLAYYGAGRSWLPSNEPRTRKKPVDHREEARRWEAFYDCFNERIRFSELREWFRNETTAAGNRGGRKRPGFEVVRHSVQHCVLDADGIWFDPDLNQIVLSIDGQAQPFENLSAGQRMMLALVADIAIKAVTQNAHLLPPDDLHIGPGEIPRILMETPGVVLIDELEVHLHPRWQRQVANDLKANFPSLQFICASHSPQVIGELKREEIRLLDNEGVFNPPRSYGIDSNRILEEIMDARSRNEEVEKTISEVAEKIDAEDFSSAERGIEELEESLGKDDPEVTRARSLMSFLGGADEDDSEGY